MNDMKAFGTFERSDETIDVRFERHYPHPIEKVWRAITDPDRLADWMGRSEVEPRKGGRIEMMLDHPGKMHGVITEWEPPTLLEFEWNNWDSEGALVRYELASFGKGTRMVFTHRSMPYDSSALMLPGWHLFFDRLGAALGDEAPAASWGEMQAAYVRQYALTGVRLGH